MSKTAWKPSTMLYPIPPVMVTSGTMEKSNIFTAAWTGIVCSDPAMTYVSIRPERHSYGLIKESGEFVINLTTADLLKSADLCGVKSGKDVNKFEETGLTAAACEHVKAPMIAESPVSLECRVTKIEHLGSHDMFLAEIVGVYVDDAYLDEKGSFEIEKSNLVAFCHGAYYAVGGEIGTFGFSVMKKKTRKARISEIKAERREMKKIQDKAKNYEETENEENDSENQGKRKPNRKFSKDGRRPFNRDRKPYGERERKPFDRDRKPYGERERKPFDRDRKPYGERERKPFGDRKPFGGRKPSSNGPRPNSAQRPSRRPAPRKD